MTNSIKGNRAIRISTDALAANVIERATEGSERYARDPFLHLEEGHAVVLDLETLKPSVLDPWPHQREIISEWIDLDSLAETGELRFRNVHEEKSRQMGITWIAAYVCLWALKWHPVAGLALSLKVSEIADSGFTTDSFFGKIRYLVDYEGDVGGFPRALRPRFTFTGGGEPLIRSASGGFLTGSGATRDPGRGGHYDFGFLDEFARVPFGRSVQASIARAIPSGRFYNSTPAGEDNEFYRLRYLRRPAGMRILRHHWSMHPLYGRGAHVAAAIDADGTAALPGDRSCARCLGTLAGETWDPETDVAHRFPGKLTSPWYDIAAGGDLDDEQVAAELDIDYAASLSARVYAEFSEERHVAADEIPLVRELPVELGWDYGADTTAVIICQDTPLEYRIIGEVEIHDTLPEEVARAVKRELRSLGVDPNELDLPQLSKMILSIGDPAGEQRQQATGRSLVSDYRKFGFAIDSRPRGVLYTIRAVKRLLNGRPKELVISQRCPKTIWHFKHNRWPTDRQGNRKPDAPAPDNNEHNHSMRAFAYLAAWKFPLPEDDESIREATRAMSGGESGVLSPDVSYDTMF